VSSRGVPERSERRLADAHPVRGPGRGGHLGALPSAGEGHGERLGRGLSRAHREAPVGHRGDQAHPAPAEPHRRLPALGGHRVHPGAGVRAAGVAAARLHGTGSGTGGRGARRTRLRRRLGRPRRRRAGRAGAPRRTGGGGRGRRRRPRGRRQVLRRRLRDGRRGPGRAHDEVDGDDDGRHTGCRAGQPYQQVAQEAGHDTIVTDALTFRLMSSVLVVEDYSAIRAAQLEVLSGHGHAVKTAHQGFEALREITQSPPDIVVLDLGLPDLDGLDVLRMIRGISRVPVLVATARDDDTEIIRLLNAGADAYLAKPFSGGQLAARLGAVLRRSAPADTGAPTPRTAHLPGRSLPRTRREFDLLAYLAAHADQVVSRQRSLTEVWQQPYLEEQTVDVHLSALRRKLGEKARQPRYLHTVR